MYICICSAVTERQIHKAVAGGARTVGDLKRQLGVGTGCGACASLAEEVLEEELEGQSRSSALPPKHNGNGTADPRNGGR
ncbi:MAG: (2Fe-2S)-binding protein [Gammaproteobacteria bacterium]